METPKAVVNYRLATSLDEMCGRCMYFDAEDGDCVMVAGEADANYVCNLFRAATGPDDMAADPDDCDMPMMMSGTIAKADPGRRMVFGWANVSMTSTGAEVIDAHADSIEPAALEAAAYDHVLNFRATGEMHKGEALGRLVESFFVNADKLEAMGLPSDALPTAWWVGYKVDDPEVFAKVLDGTYRSFSIQGRAERVPVEDS